MSKPKLLYFSITLSVMSITLTIIINFQIADAYIKADGKSKALFGLIEHLAFGHQYYIAIIGLVSLLLAMRVKENTTYKYSACILSLFAIVLVFLRIWSVFVTD